MKWPRFRDEFQPEDLEHRRQTRSELRKAIHDMHELEMQLIQLTQRLEIYEHQRA